MRGGEEVKEHPEQYATCFLAVFEYVFLNINTSRTYFLMNGFKF
jgi:hypothetical protein